MRNYYFIAVLVGLLFMGCTVDNDELIFNEDQIKTVNVEINDVCLPSIYEIEDSGELLGNVTISNSDDGNIAYVKFSAETGYYITEIRLMKTDDVTGLPINNGGIIPGKLEKLTYDFLSEVNFEFEFSSFFVLAARVTFMNDEGMKFTSWIGDELAGNNKSTYLNYYVCIPKQQEPVCEANAGSDNSATFSYKELLSRCLDSDGIENLYLNLLDEDVSRSGTFDPTIKEILKFVYANEANRYGDHTTTYTVTSNFNGEICTDSAILTITTTK